jgi:hypothetical protein
VANIIFPPYFFDKIFPRKKKPFGLVASPFQILQQCKIWHKKTPHWWEAKVFCVWKEIMKKRVIIRETGGGGPFIFHMDIRYLVLERVLILGQKLMITGCRNTNYMCAPKGPILFWVGETGERILFYFFHSECVLIMFPSNFKWVPNKLPKILMCFITCL